MKTTIQELIEEFENIKKTKCKTLQEMMFFDGVLAIIETKYLEKEKTEIIDSYLAGKLFSDGTTFAPNSSLDIATEWFNEKYKNE